MIVAPARESIALDRLDRQLLHALKVDGRAPFRRLAHVLGTSEQTIARRYRRLHGAGVVRVVVVPNPDIYRETWIVRAQIQPPSAARFADAIAEREDVAWVALTGGGTEVTFTVRTHTTAARDALLLERLPRARQVLGVSAAAMLHRYGGGPEAEWGELPDRLDADQLAALRVDRPPPSPRAVGAPVAADTALLAALAGDGRASYAALAARTGDTESRVGRRVEALLASGAVIVDIEFATELLGFAASACLWMTVAPTALEAVGSAVAAHPQVPFAGAVSGPTNLVATVLTRDADALYGYVTRSLGPIDGLQAVEVVPILRRIKQARIRLDGSRLPAQA